MRAIFTGYATGAVITASIFSLLRAPVPWEMLASGGIAALLAIAWRPVASNTITLNGVQSVSRSSDGKTSTWQVETAAPPERAR